MRKIVCIIFIFLSLTPLGATWEIGQAVDDFGDAVGKKFAYCLIDDGTFSNSATMSSPLKVRVIAELNRDEFPGISFKFETHEYNWNNPTNQFYSHSKSLLQFKDETEEVLKFNGQNTKNSVSWNKLFGDEANLLFFVMERNNSLKSAFSCENTKYNFTIGTAGLSDVINELVKDTITESTDNWIVKVRSGASPKKQFVSASKYFKLEDVSIAYGLVFTISGYPLDPIDSPSISISLYSKYNWHTPYGINDSDIIDITLRNGKEVFVIETNYPTIFPYFRIRDIKNVDVLFSLFDEGEITEIELNFKHQRVGDFPIRIELESKELKKYLTYPYPDSIMKSQ